jgi:hypothetical protein
MKLIDLVSLVSKFAPASPGYIADISVSLLYCELYNVFGTYQAETYPC